MRSFEPSVSEMIKAFIRERALEGNNASANCQLICWVNNIDVMLMMIRSLFAIYIYYSQFTNSPSSRWGWVSYLKRHCYEEFIPSTRGCWFKSDLLSQNIWPYLVWKFEMFCFIWFWYICHIWLFGWWLNSKKVDFVLTKILNRKLICAIACICCFDRSLICEWMIPWFNQSPRMKS